MHGQIYYVRSCTLVNALGRKVIALWTRENESFHNRYFRFGVRRVSATSAPSSPDAALS